MQPSYALSKKDNYLRQVITDVLRLQNFKITDPY